MLIAGLRKEFDIIDDVHEEILEAVMSNTERPNKRSDTKHVYYPQELSQHPLLPWQHDVHLCLIRDVSPFIL